MDEAWDAAVFYLLYGQARRENTVPPVRFLFLDVLHDLGCGGYCAPRGTNV